jgi:two-component system cell cycle response regulator DivK
MDGYEVTSRLRQIPQLSSVPIIALTAKVLRGDRERSLAAGCDGYIQKPLDVDMLPSQVEAFLRRSV